MILGLVSALRDALGVAAGFFVYATILVAVTGDKP